jgi:hypothetical protein
MVWHQILGNIEEKGLQVLHGKCVVSFSLDFDFYEHLFYGKNNHVRFSSGAMREEEILQLVHNDVFGPVSVPSLGKSVYYVSFTNEFLRNTYIYLLRKKYEVFHKFKEFKAPVEN